MKDPLIIKSENDLFRFGVESNLPFSECILTKKETPEMKCQFDFSTQQKSNPIKTCPEVIFNSFAERLTFVESPATASFKCELELKDLQISGEYLDIFKPF